MSMNKAKKIFVGVLSLISVAANATDFKTQLNGKDLIMSGANCAGISLKKNSGLKGEMGNIPPCSVDLPARLKWINESTFVMVEKNKTNDTSPPRVYLYKVKSIKGNQVVLTEVWTGWNDLPDDDITYTIK